MPNNGLVWESGVFLCIRCSGIHRGMGTHISKVKSVDLDVWTPEQMEVSQFVFVVIHISPQFAAIMVVYPEVGQPSSELVLGSAFETRAYTT